MSTIGLGVTVGNYSLRAVKMRRKRDGTYVVQRVFADRLNDDTRPVAGRALAARGFKGAAATVGLTGRDVIIRYSQVPPVPEWRLRTLMKYEVDEVGSQSGGDVSADYRKLDLPDPEGERSEDTILVALARNSYLDSLLGSCAAGAVKVGATCPNSVALFNAFAVNATYTEEETSLLVNIGAENMDLAVQRGGALIFARNANAGGRAFTEAIQQAFSTTPGKAEQMKLAKADVTPRGQARYPDASSEKVANAIMGAAGQLASLIQSTLMIARAQAKMPDLKVDRVLLAGGGASLKGLDKYLNQAMGVRVERFDPFAVSDLSELTEDERALVQRAPHEFAVAVGLAQGPVDPLAFPLEVLPTAMRRRREFATKGVWSVAAAGLALAILGVLYQSRTHASAEARSKLSALRGLDREAQRQDDAFRKVLDAVQDLQVKHRLLAETMAPGALLGRTWKVLQENMADQREVYLKSVALHVGDSTYEFPYFRAKGKATGYEESLRQRGSLHESSVDVEGRISARLKATDIYAKFFTGCKGNDQGLLVETVRRLQSGGGGDDMTFTIRFLPGHVLKTVTAENAQPIEVPLTDVTLDDATDPKEIRGRRTDGVMVSIPIEKLTKEQQRTLVPELKSAMAALPKDN